LPIDLSEALAFLRAVACPELSRRSAFPENCPTLYLLMKEVYNCRYRSASGVPSEINCLTYRARVPVTSSGAVVVDVFVITPPTSIEVMEPSLAVGLPW
jgi:hypothetical protein